MIQVQSVFNRFFDRLMQNRTAHSISDNLELLIRNYLQASSSDKDWRYHFVASGRILSDKGDIFAWTAPELFVIERLRGANLQSDHINPFYLDLVEQANLPDEALQYTYYHELSSIEVRSGTSLFLTTSGWKIHSDQLSDNQIENILNTSSHANLSLQGKHLLQIL